MAFALMAALDGASELVIPNSDDDTFSFHCRSFVQTRIPIWKQIRKGECGDATLTPKVEQRSTKLLSLLGKGTRHHSAYALSCDLGTNALVITLSADGPVSIWRNGEQLKSKEGELKYAP